MSEKRIFLTMTLEAVHDPLIQVCAILGEPRLMTFLLAAGIVSASMLGLALSVVFGRAPLRGSCGGFACIEGIECEGCTKRRDVGEGV